MPTEEETIVDDYPYVVIEWMDARSEDDWTCPEDLDMQLACVTTFGHLVRETESIVCVASSADKKTGQLCGIMYIPRPCILQQLTVTVNGFSPKG